MAVSRGKGKEIPSPREQGPHLGVVGAVLGIEWGAGRESGAVYALSCVSSAVMPLEWARL